MNSTLHTSLLVAALAGLTAGCSSDARTEDHAIVNDATRLPDAAPALSNTTGRTELDRVAPAEYETATFALG